MTESAAQNIQFVLLTLFLMALIFLILWLVSRAGGKAFRKNKDKLFAEHKMGPRDIVLLSDGSRVKLLEAIDGGESYLAETIADYGKRPEKVTVSKEEIVKIEYYA